MPCLGISLHARCFTPPTDVPKEARQTGSSLLFSSHRGLASLPSILLPHWAPAGHWLLHETLPAHWPSMVEDILRFTSMTASRLRRSARPRRWPNYMKRPMPFLSARSFPLSSFVFFRLPFFCFVLQTVKVIRFFALASRCISFALA